MEAHPAPRLEVVIPVYNEERAPRGSVERLCRRLAADVGVPFQVTIGDNASTDRTADVARSLEREVACVRYLHVNEKGRGRALRAAWSASDAEVLAYMDVDLSTDLVHLPALIDALLAGRADIAIGSRLAPGAQVTRGLKREVISRCYNALLGVVLGAGSSDAQCGFKAGRRDAMRAPLPLVESEEWFFRYRAPLPGAAQRLLHPGGPGPLDRRHRLAGAYRAHHRRGPPGRGAPAPAHARGPRSHRRSFRSPTRRCRDRQSAPIGAPPSVG